MQDEDNTSFLVIYHDKCPDGLTAKSIAQLHFERVNVQNKIAYYAGKHGDIFPVELAEDKIVYFLDFVYPEDQFVAIKNVAKKIYVLDHHISNLNYLEKYKDYDKVNTRYCTTSKSGAGIAWSFFFPKSPEPSIVTYIQDRDIWSWNSNQTKPFLTALEKDGINQDIYYDILKLYVQENFQEYNRVIEDITEKGKAYLEYFNSVCEQLSKDYSYVNFKNYKNIPIINCPSKFASEVGNLIAEQHPKSFVILYNIREQEVRLSFRSVSFDVTAPASLFKGGGHKQAAGARISLDQFCNTFKVTKKEDLPLVYSYSETLKPILELLSAILVIEKNIADSVSDEDFVMNITINTLKELAKLLNRTSDKHDPYCFEIEDDMLYVYDYETHIHSDINLIYQVHMKEV